jgi:hypothetical protein
MHLRVELGTTFLVTMLMGATASPARTAYSRPTFPVGVGNMRQEEGAAALRSAQAGGGEVEGAPPRPS